MARQAGTQVAGAGANHDCVNLGSRQPGLRQRALPGTGRQHRRMSGKALGQRIGVDAEHLGQRIDRQAPRLDAVVALQHGLRHPVGARIEPAKPFRRLERRQALRLGVAMSRRCGGDSGKEHGRSEPVEDTSWQHTLFRP